MTTQTDQWADTFVKAVNAAAASIASLARNMAIKVAGGYTDNEYADAMMREHRTALKKQRITAPGTLKLTEVPRLAVGGVIPGRTGVFYDRSQDGAVIPLTNGYKA